MNTQKNELNFPSECDVLIVGSGAGGLSTAITARKRGLDVVVVEKEAVFGGTTAFSGGVLWVPGNRISAKPEVSDSKALAKQYMRHEAGRHFDEPSVDAFLDVGPKMIDFFERETDVKFIPTLFPDYHPDAPGGVSIGRSILAAPYDIRSLGDDMKRLRLPLKTITFLGMMFNSSNADLKHFFRVTKSIRSAAYVAKRLTRHFTELVRYGRAIQVTAGNALASRLAKSVLDLGIPIFTQSPVTRLLTENGVVTGAVIDASGRSHTIRARKGVVLASGGFSHDIERLRQVYPHMKAGGEHHSPVPSGNTGDGARLAETVGGYVDTSFEEASAWMPVSRVPFSDGTYGVFPHLVDRYKPGFIGVNHAGRRFTNESSSYHDVGAAMIKDNKDTRNTVMWLICDHATIRKYGMGHAKPAPLPLGGYVRNGYLVKGNTLKELAEKAGIDATNLEYTVNAFNADAMLGKDTQFGRGTTAFNRYLGDADHQPNPCIAPVGKGPYYALKIYMGDLGTFDGLKTSVEGAVLKVNGEVIPGLYAVGNDRLSVMGGNYPGAGITLGPIMTFGYITGSYLAGVPLEKLSQ